MAPARPCAGLIVGAASLAGGASLALSVVGCEAPRPEYSEARRVVDRHCISCHSERPTERAFPIAPGGVVFDSPTDMVKHSERIRVRVAVDRTMPLMNKTAMTDAERELLASWVTSGAPTQSGPAAAQR